MHAGSAGLTSWEQLHQDALASAQLACSLVAVACHATTSYFCLEPEASTVLVVALAVMKQGQSPQLHRCRWSVTQATYDVAVHAPCMCRALTALPPSTSAGGPAPPVSVCRTATATERTQAAMTTSQPSRAGKAGARQARRRRRRLRCMAGRMANIGGRTAGRDAEAAQEWGWGGVGGCQGAVYISTDIYACDLLLSRAQLCVLPCVHVIEAEATEGRQRVVACANEHATSALCGLCWSPILRPLGTPASHSNGPHSATP